MPGRELRALLESEQRLRAICDGTYEYIGVLALDGTLLEANRASLEFAAGTTRDDVVGRPFWETVWFTHTPGAPEKLREAIARAATGEMFRVEWPLRRPSGETVVFGFSLRPIRDEHGDVVFIVTEGRDITNLKRAQQEAQYQEQRYRLLFERASDGIWLADQQGRFVDANPAACRMLGYSHAEHVTLTVDDLIQPEDAARLRALMAELAVGHQVTDVWDIRRADGTYIPLELSHAFTPDGRWQANGRDITVRQRAEAEREQLASRLIPTNCTGSGPRCGTGSRPRASDHRPPPNCSTRSVKWPATPSSTDLGSTRPATWPSPGSRIPGGSAWPSATTGNGSSRPPVPAGGAA